MLADFLDRVTQGDCLEVLSKIEDNSVDMTFADPPFNLEKRYTSYRDQRPVADYLEWCKGWLRELVRVTKPSGSIFVHNIPKWLTYYACILNDIAHFKHWIAWDAMSNPIGKTLLPAHYGILFYTKQLKGYKFYEIRAPHRRCRVCGNYLKDYGGKKDQMHAFGALVGDVWTDIHRIRHSVRRDDHPCQLPIPLLERIVLMSTDPGDVVLDPFLGTGTTAVAAKALGRHFVGIDLDQAYVNLANNKLSKVKETTYQGFHVSYYLREIQSIRDVDAASLFPHQLTTTEKKRNQANGGSPQSLKYDTATNVDTQRRLLQKRNRYGADSRLSPSAGKQPDEN